MKMKLFAAAVAALAAGGAYAQSSVTLYGVVDVGIEYQNNQNNAGGNSIVRMQSGNMSGSRWGLRGVEDLGGGLKGVFVLESGFNTDAGTQGQNSRIFGRQSYVGLSSQWGTLTAGRHQTPFYDFGRQFDPMAIAPSYSILSQDGAFTGRADNSLKYVGTFGGLTASALYSFGAGFNGGGGATNGEVPGSSKIGREYSFGLTYAAGPFAVGAIYDETNLGLNGPAATIPVAPDAKIRRASIAGNYAFGPLKAFLGYRWAKGFDVGTLPGAVAGGKNSSNLYWAGLGYQVTPAFSLTGAAYYQDFRGSSADPWSFVASADYAFSKRTDAYLNLGYTRNKDGSNLGLTTANNTTTNFGNSGFGTTGVDKNQFGAVVGVRRKF